MKTPAIFLKGRALNLPRVALLCLLSVPVAACAETLIGSAPLHRSATAAGPSLAPVLSGDGRTVVFLSSVNNLVANDDLGTSLDVFARDLLAERTSLVSVNVTGSGGGNDHSGVPAVSGNGRWVAFESDATNLVPNDTNGVKDVFLRDLLTGETRLLSVPASGDGGGNGPSGAPSISADGRWVVFESAASNLVDAALESAQQIYARDWAAGRTILVSRDTTAAGLNPGPATSVSITPDGRFVAFVKQATNFVQGTLSAGEVYLRDLQTDTTYWASEGVTSSLVGPRYVCVNPALSSDGRFVLFRATDRGVGPGLLFRHDRQLGATDLVEQDASVQDGPALSANGRFIAYATSSGVYLWDAATGTSRVICENLPDPVSRTCTRPALAAGATRIGYVLTTNNAPTVVVHDWESGTQWYASLTTNGAPAVAGELAPILSANGEQVVFEAIDARLLAEDWNRTTDIFSHDLRTRQTSLVSRQHPDRPALTSFATVQVPGSMDAAGRQATYFTYESDGPVPFTNEFGEMRVHNFGNGQLQSLGPVTNTAFAPVASADGRYLAYASRLDQIDSSAGARTVGDVYWADLVAGRNVFVGRLDTGLDLMSTTPFALSADGQWVAYQSADLAGNADGGVLGFISPPPWIFMRNMRTETNTVISVVDPSAGNPWPAGAGSSFSPLFSPDGRWVVFQSTSVSLTPQRTGGLFARDLVNNKTLFLGTNYSASALMTPSFSADSRFVVFRAPGIGGTSQGFEFNLQPGTRAVVCTNCSNLTVSADGRLVAYRATVPNGTYEVYVRDMANGQVEWISVALSGGINLARRPSYNPVVSYDGRYVVFANAAADLVPNDTNGVSDIFVRDRLRGVTFLASAERTGTRSGNGASVSPVLAADGRTILFYSVANDLVQGDYNQAGDVFVVRLGGPDTDADGLDDDWEMAYFSMLSRDGAGDFDADGQSDKGEFLSGTDPVNSGSILRVRTLRAASGTGTTILWDSAPGRTYRVEWKNSVDGAGWTAAVTPVVAAGTTATWLDPQPADSRRFYRVALMP